MGSSGFFNDGTSDILFQNTNGSVALWDMQGLAIVGGGLASSNPGPAWQVVGMAGGVAITPGSGFITDVLGHVYTITADGVGEVDGAPLPGGGTTAKLVLYNGNLYGQDSTTGLWFQLFNDNSFGASPPPGFFSDGDSAVVLQNTNGSVALWDMNGTTVVGGGLVASNPGPAWHVKGTGTFFGDGNTAILFQNSDGSVALWDMSGINIVAGGLVTDSNPGATWHIDGTGDFYQDGHTDVLFQNDDGSVALWDMSGTSIIAGGLVANAGAGWHIKGTGDFFRDGNTDILFQNDNGSVALWDIHAGAIIGGGLVANAGAGWVIKGTGDYFNDGNTDILFQNANGSIALWDMKGTTIVGGGLVGNSGSGWNALDDMMRFIYSTSADETLTATAMAPDEFVFTTFAAGLHTIDGFNTEQDIIALNKTDFASFADVQAATSSVSGGALINLGNGSSLLLAGVSAGSLHASDFAIA